MERDPNHSGSTEESDQLPEEAPPEVVEEDAGGAGDARDEAEESAGVPDDPGQATGHPDNAG
jgi:hypothetical protein